MARHKIEYDKGGHMKYNPYFHGRQYDAWNKFDLQYLIDWYEKIGIKEMSFALERTEYTILYKVRELRRRGLMPPARARKQKKKAISAPTKVTLIAMDDSISDTTISL